jgi:MFS family permease
MLMLSLSLKAISGIKRNRFPHRAILRSLRAMNTSDTPIPKTAPLVAAGSGPSLRWTVFSGLSALLVGLGLSRFAYTPLIPAIIHAGWLSPADAVYAGAANLTGYLVGAITVARLSRSIRDTWLIRGAMLACVLAFVASAFPLGLLWLSVWRFISGIAGAFLMVLTPPRVLAITPAHWRGRVGGLVFVGVGLGIIVSATVLPWVLQWGLSQAWMVLAAISLLLTVLTWRGFPSPPLAAAKPPAVRQSTALQGASAQLPKNSRTARTLTPALAWIVIAYGVSAAGYAPHMVIWVDYIARGLGRGLTVGAGYWVLFGVAAAGAPVLLGLVADRIGFAAGFRLSLLANAATIALPLVSTEPWSLALSSIGVGGLVSGGTSLASARLSGLLPLEQRRRVWGWMTTCFSVLFAIGGYGVSFLFARTGSYTLLFALGSAAILLAVGLDCLASLGKKTRP